MTRGKQRTCLSVRSRRLLLRATCILALLAWWQPRFVLRWLTACVPEVMFFGQTKQPLVALTIDDSPHPTLTPRILEVLAAHNARATFFIIGERVPGNEHLIHRMMAEGHEVGNHHLRNIPSICLASQEFEEQLLLTHNRLAPFGPIRWFRPASGWFTRRMLRQLAQHGYTCVLGSAYAEDLVSSVAYLTHHILLNTQAGSIIILHDGAEERARTVTVLARVLPELQRRGYRIVTLSALVASMQREQYVIRKSEHFLARRAT